MDDPLDAVRHLRATINDLISVVTLPAVLQHRSPQRLIVGLLDILLKILPLEFAYARLDAITGGSPIEAIRFPKGSRTTADPRKVGQSLEPWLSADIQTVRRSIPNPIGDGETTIVDLWLGPGKETGVVVVGAARKDFPTDVDTLLLRAAVNAAIVELQRAQILAANNRAAESDRIKSQLQTENVQLRKELFTGSAPKIVGHSKALKRVLKLVEQVAPTNACVLIEGETGTGKELIARTVHRMSHRKDRPFVKLNCAAIPSGLLESELFGHEKGAFTGAVAQKLGMFESAHKGTIFLDEVSEIPLELQVKLLTVLQEQEFERLGGTRTIRVDVRLVAATNQDLRQMVTEKRFRSDLFYRLNVFPIQIPPLRERSEDIPLLIHHFIEKYSLQFGKQISTVPAGAMEALCRWSWPGNIRELENFIARSVIISRGETLELPESELRPAAKQRAQRGTLREMERELIRKTVETCNWVIGGPSGAAARLGMKRTSLQHKMKKLGITRPGR